MTFWDEITEKANDDRRERFVTSQLYMNDWIAQLREHYRLAQLFPVHMVGPRKRVGDHLTSILTLACNVLDIRDMQADWRLPGRQFEALLLEIVERLGVNSVEDALNVSHVNFLHDTWSRMARRNGFAFPPELRGEFGSVLIDGLAAGGSVVRDKWLCLPAYSLD